MSKMPWYKKALLAVTVFILLVLVGLAAAVVFVDPSWFRPFLARQIQAGTGLAADFQGPVKWSFRPYLGLEFNQVVLKNPADGTVLLDVDSAEVEFKLRPLLSRRLEINRLKLARPIIRLATGPSGRLLLPEQAAGHTPPPPAEAGQPAGLASKPRALDIARLEITEADLLCRGPAAVITLKLASLSLGEAHFTQSADRSSLSGQVEHLVLNDFNLAGFQESEIALGGLSARKLGFTTRSSGAPLNLALQDLALQRGRFHYKAAEGQAGNINLDQAALNNLELTNNNAEDVPSLRLALLQLDGFSIQELKRDPTRRLAWEHLRLNDLGFVPEGPPVERRQLLTIGDLTLKEARAEGPLGPYGGEGRLGQLELEKLLLKLEEGRASTVELASLNLSQAAGQGLAGPFDGQAELGRLTLKGLASTPGNKLEERFQVNDLAVADLKVDGRMNREALKLNLARLELGPPLESGARPVTIQGDYNRLAVSGSLALGLPLKDDLLTLGQLALTIRPPAFSEAIALSGQTAYHLKSGALSFKDFKAQGAGLRLTANGQAGTKPASWQGHIQADGPLAPTLKALGLIKADRPPLAVNLSLGGAWPVRGPEGLSLNGSLDGSRIQADLKPADAAGFQGCLTIDKLNLNDYQALMSSSGEKAAPATKTGPGSIDPNLKIKNPLGDFGPLVVNVGRLTLLPELELADFQATARAKGNQVTITPLTFNVFEGSYNGQAGLNLAQAPPLVTAKGPAENLNLKSAQNWLFGLAPLTGQGRFDFDINFRASPTLLNTLGGRAGFKATNSQVQNLLKPLPLIWPGAAKYNEELHSINTVSGTFTLKNGLASTSDLVAAGPRFEARGRGTVNLPQAGLNLDLTLDVKAKNMVPVAANLSGPFSDLKWNIDAAQILKEAAQNSDRLNKALGLDPEKSPKSLEDLGGKLEKKLLDKLPPLRKTNHDKSSGEMIIIWGNNFPQTSSPGYRHKAMTITGK